MRAILASLCICAFALATSAVAQPFVIPLEPQRPPPTPPPQPSPVPVAPPQANAPADDGSSRQPAPEVDTPRDAGSQAPGTQPAR